MSFEASLTQYSQTKFTNALSCLARFGEEIHIQALDQELFLSTLNSSKTSYAQFTFSHAFFESYHVKMPTKAGVKCHLNAKALLGVFKSKGRLEKTAERCDLSMYDSEAALSVKNKNRPKKKRRVRDSDGSGSEPEDEEDEDLSSIIGKGPPSRLNIKFHCAHGFIKTHSMFISNAHTLRRPTNSLENEPEYSSFKVSPKLVNEWMEPFPGWNAQPGKGSTGGKLKEGYVAWTFGDDGVKIGTWESNARADKLSTEFMVDSGEFDEFSLAIAPVSLGVPMRELKAITFLSSQLQVPLSCFFTTPLQPLYVQLSHQDDVFDVGFTIMPQEVPKSSGAAVPVPVPNRRDNRGRPGAGSGRKTLRMDAVADEAADEDRDGDGDQEMEMDGEMGMEEETTSSKSKGKGKAKDHEREREKSQQSKTSNSAPSSSRRRDANPSNQAASSSYRYPEDNNDNFDDGYRSPRDAPEPAIPPRNSRPSVQPSSRAHSVVANSMSPPPPPSHRHNGGKPPGEESLFMPASQDPPASQSQRPSLSQRELDEAGLGNLEDIDWDDMDDEETLEVEPEPEPVKRHGARTRLRVRQTRVDEEQEEEDEEMMDDDDVEHVPATRREGESTFRLDKDRPGDEDDDDEVESFIMDDPEDDEAEIDPTKENRRPSTSTAGGRAGDRSMSKSL